MQEVCACCGKEMLKVRINKHTKEPEELCPECLYISISSAYGVDEPDDDDIYVRGYCE